MNSVEGMWAEKSWAEESWMLERAEVGVLETIVGALEIVGEWGVVVKVRRERGVGSW